MPTKFVIVGQNGSGKTAFLESVYKRSSLLFDNFVSDDPQFPHLIREHIRRGGQFVLMDQKPFWLFPSRSVLTILSVPLVLNGFEPGQAEARASSVLSYFNANHLSLRDYKTLSGGERCLVDVLARALLQPDLLLLDGSLAMLDRDRQASLVTFLASEEWLTSPMTMVMTTAEVERLNEIDTNAISLVRTSSLPSSPIVLEDIFDETAISLGEPREIAKIQLQEHTASFGKTQVLVGVTAAFDPGIYVLSAPNGSGKTLLLRSLTTRQRSHRNTILKYGEGGYFPQDPNGILGFGTLGQELEKYGIPTSCRDKIVREFAKANLLQPAGSVRSASLGECQFYALLIFFATALFRNWNVVLMDEPDAGLDEQRATVCVQMVRFLAREQKKVVIVASHRPDIYRPLLATGEAVKFLTIEDKKIRMVSA